MSHLKDIDLRILLAIRSVRGAIATTRMIGEELYDAHGVRSVKGDDVDREKVLENLSRRIPERYNLVLGPHQHGFVERVERGVYQLTERGMEAADVVAESETDIDDDHAAILLWDELESAGFGDGEQDGSGDGGDGEVTARA